MYSAVAVLICSGVSTSKNLPLPLCPYHWELVQQKFCGLFQPCGEECWESQEVYDAEHPREKSVPEVFRMKSLRLYIHSHGCLDP